MNKATNNIGFDILIGKYLSGNASAEEVQELKQWEAASPENHRTMQRSVKVWRGCNYRLSAEATKNDEANIVRQIQRLQHSEIARTKKQLLILKIAATLAIPLTFLFSWYFLSQTEKTTMEDQIFAVTAPKGHVSKCTLPDGTEIWINTGSTLVYNTAAFNKKQREVKLEGEAYFDVAKNKEKPFRVITPAANINVTGTSFNVKNYAGSNSFETVLTNGCIEMQLNNASRQTVKLVPGEKATFLRNKKGITIEKVDPEVFSSWRNGEIIFKDATLNDLIAELERIYDIKFHLKNQQLGRYRFRGMFSYNNNLIDALEKIKQTAGINYYIENKEVWLSSK